jgi:hypothetical protein
VNLLDDPLLGLSPEIIDFGSGLVSPWGYPVMNASHAAETFS